MAELKTIRIYDNGIKEIYDPTLVKGVTNEIRGARVIEEIEATKENIATHFGEQVAEDVVESIK